MNQATTRATVDCDGRVVRAGTQIRVIALPESVLVRLDPDERKRVESMLGETFEVCEIDEWGAAWVQKWWYETNEKSMSHSLGLGSKEMQVAADDLAGKP